MSFTADVHRIAEKIGDSVENVASATFIELFASVIKDTPVDTGRLRGNWQTTKNSPAQGETKRTGGSVAIAEAHAVVRKPDLYYLTNNLPYAARIEFDGYSKIKAPLGMVRINAKRLKRILREQAR
jgi:hypothetical protein